MKVEEFCHTFTLTWRNNTYKTTFKIHSSTYTHAHPSSPDTKRCFGKTYGFTKQKVTFRIAKRDLLKSNMYPFAAIAVDKQYSPPHHQQATHMYWPSQNTLPHSKTISPYPFTKSTQIPIDCVLEC